MTEWPDVFQSNTVYFRHWFVESCKCLSVILGFLKRRKKLMYFIRPRNYPTWQGIVGHFTITGKLGEKPTCVHLLRHKTYKSYWVELVSVHFEAALHETCYWCECVKHNMQHRENSLYPDYTDWSLEFSGTLTGPPIRNNDRYAWNPCKQSTGKVKLISILYRLKLFTLILISFLVQQNQLTWAGHHS